MLFRSRTLVAPSSSAKKVAKLASRGKGKKVHFQGGTTFPTYYRSMYPKDVIMTGDLTMRATRREFERGGAWLKGLGVPVTVTTPASLAATLTAWMDRTPHGR